MERFWKDVRDRLPAAVKARVKSYVAPGAECTTRKHTEFDGDLASMNTLLGIVLGGAPVRPFTQAELDSY
jgi:hypothetical protein